MNIQALLISVTLLALLAQPAAAHHSFAVHFVAEGTVEVAGIVDSFRFSNPHGILTFTVIDANGQSVQWRAETNSPNILRRRGWSKDSLRSGDAITVSGFPARDGSNYMRISRITFADGRELLGQAATAPAAEQD